MDRSTYEIISLIINALIMVAGFSAIIIYKVQKRDKIKTAATILISQIDAIESIIKDLRSTNPLTNEIIYKSKVILDRNYWSESKYLLFKKLGTDNVRLIEEFYAHAEYIEKSREAICHELISAWEHKDFILQKFIADYSTYPDEQRSKSLQDLSKNFEASSKIFSPSLPISILVNNLSQFNYLLGTTAYKKLSNISYRSR